MFDKNARIYQIHSINTDMFVFTQRIDVEFEAFQPDGLFHYFVGIFSDWVIINYKQIDVAEGGEVPFAYELKSATNLRRSFRHSSPTFRLRFWKIQKEGEKKT